MNWQEQFDRFILRLTRMKKKAFWLVLCSSILLHVTFIWPFLQSCTHMLIVFRDQMPGNAPTLTLQNAHLTLEGDLPFVHRFSNQVVWHFTLEPNAKMIENSPAWSAIFSDSLLYYKTATKVDSIKLSAIKSNVPVVITAEKAIGYFSNSVRFINIIGNAVLFILIWIVLTFLTLFGTGLGTIIDVFNEGPFNFAHLLNISAAVLVCESVLLIVIQLAWPGSLKFLLLAAFYLISLQVLFGYLVGVIFRKNWSIYGQEF